VKDVAQGAETHSGDKLKTNLLPTAAVQCGRETTAIFCLSSEKRQTRFVSVVRSYAISLEFGHAHNKNGRRFSIRSLRLMYRDFGEDSFDNSINDGYLGRGRSIKTRAFCWPLKSCFSRGQRETGYGRTAERRSGNALNKQRVTRRVRTLVVAVVTSDAYHVQVRSIRLPRVGYRTRSDYGGRGARRIAYEVFWETRPDNDGC